VTSWYEVTFLYRVEDAPSRLQLHVIAEESVKDQMVADFIGEVIGVQTYECYTESGPDNAGAVLGMLYLKVNEEILFGMKVRTLPAVIIP
jgi:hypothetical protein